MTAKFPIFLAQTLYRNACPEGRRAGSHRTVVAPEGQAGFGALTAVLISLLAAVASSYTIAQNNAVMSESMKLLRLQQTVVLLGQAAQRLAAEAGDVDGDGYRETPAMRTGVGGPAGGGVIPLTSAAGKTDGWGRPIGYCAWDYGGTTTSAGMINPGRGSTNSTEIVLLTVSAGPNGVFETACPTDPNGVVPTAVGDDLLLGFTAGEVAQRASITDTMLAFLNSLIAGQYRPPSAAGLDIAGTLTVGSGLPAGTQALLLPDGLVQSLGRRLSQAVYDVTTARSGDVVAQPACPSGTTARIYTALMHIAADNAGTAWSAAQSYAMPIMAGGAAAWQVVIDVRTSTGWTSPSPSDVARALVVTKCE